MTTDPEPELQKGIVARLRGDAGVTALVGEGIFDNPSPTAPKPYISFVETQRLPSRAEGYNGSSIDVVLKAYSAKKTKEEVKRIGAAMSDAIDDRQDDFVLDGHRVVSAAFVRSDVLTEPDGLTQSIASRFTFLTEPE